MEFIPENPLLKFHPDTLDVLRKMYNLDKGRMKQSVDLLEDWAKKQAHFVNKKFPRRYYEVSIIACKGSVEKAKAQIDKLCTLKSLLPKYFICQNLRESVSRIRNLGCAIPLPKMTHEYQRIYLIKIFDGDFDSSHFLDYWRLHILVVEYLKAHDYVDGFVIVQDFRDANLVEIMKKINFVDLQQFMTILIEGFGAKMKAIHFISDSKLIDYFVKTVKNFLSPKIAKRLHVHQTLEDIHNIIDKDLLPVDFGGSEKPLRELQDDWLNAICSEDHQKYLEVMAKSRTDENLRKVDKFNEQHIGLPGSFRTLVVD